MAHLIDTVRLSIERHGLLSRGETVVVGVSGGPDSLCLLHVLCRLAGEKALSLRVAHLHHGLRGDDADADADFVRRVAADWGVPCIIEQIRVRSVAERHSIAVEEAARRVRYAFLGRVAEEAGAHTVAVGHNADDQAETILMHWLRGSGLAGLRGMQPSLPLAEYRLLQRFTPSSSVAEVRLIRPLLEVTRHEIEAYCAYYGLEPRFDRSNLDTTYFRNWLRHTVLPLLASHNPNVKEVLRRSAQVVAGDYALLRALLEERWPLLVLEEEPKRIVFDLDAWRALPISLQRSTIREAVHRLRRTLRDISFVHVENAVRVARDGTTGDRSTLPAGLLLSVDYDALVVASGTAPPDLPDWPLLSAGPRSEALRIPGDTRLPGSEWVLQSQLLDASDLPLEWATNTDPWAEVLDAESAGRNLWLRTRAPGDRFQPLGMKGHTVKLGDFLTNQKVPRHLRDRLPLLVRDGEIVWVCGLRLGERFRVHDETDRVLALKFLRRTEPPL